MWEDLFAHLCIFLTFQFIGGIFFKDIHEMKSSQQKIVFGFFMGVLGTILMFFSIQLTPTVIMDLRYLSILQSAFYGGPVSTFITVAMIIINRWIFINNAPFPTIVSMGIMICIGVFSILIMRKKYSSLKTWLYMNIVSIVVLSIGFLALLENSKETYMLLIEYWIVIILGGLLTFYVGKYISDSNNNFILMKKQAATDFLTGLNNNRQFQYDLKTSIEKTQKNNGNLTLLLVDIDFFKRINDTFGHVAGDEVLRQLAFTLSSCTRSFDIVSRNGGEEFTILLLNNDHSEGMEMAERIRNSVENHAFILPNGKEINVTTSIGVATYPQTTPSPEALFNQADEALYYAKGTGRNKVSSIKEF